MTRRRDREMLLVNKTFAAAQLAILWTILIVGTGPALSQDRPSDIGPCSGLPDDPAFLKYRGLVTMNPTLPAWCGRQAGMTHCSQEETVCTEPIPKRVVVTRMTCQAWEARAHTPCGVIACPWAPNLGFSMRVSANGDRQYCWSVRNEYTARRDFTVSVTDR
jgi:hypothetical protein